MILRPQPRAGQDTTPCAGSAPDAANGAANLVPGPIASGRGVRAARVSEWQPDRLRETRDLVAEEVPVALVYNGVSHVVMMATPCELEDFALGFSLTEGVIGCPAELYGLDIQTHPEGMVIEMDIAARRFQALKQQRRNLSGRTGCGLCGVESLQQLQPRVPTLNLPPVTDNAIQAALRQLDDCQPLRRATGACHGAAWCSRAGEIVLAREDVGRHNALDKLIGALSRPGFDPAGGFVLISSRASYEMVLKTVSMGIGTLVAVSAPTSLALDVARRAGAQLVGFCRQGRHLSYP